MFNFKKVNKFFVLALGIWIFLSPINMQAASIFSQNSYVRKTFRIVGGVGLITLCAERMISNSKRETEFDFYSLASIWAAYQGLKFLSQEL